MRVALIRLLSNTSALILRAAAGMTADREWVLPGALPAAGQEIRVASVAGNIITWEYFTSAGGSSGTVTSVGLTAPVNEFDVGAAITSAGSLTLAWKNQNPNLVLASPVSGGAGAPTFRALVEADIPNISATKLTTGTVAFARLPVGTASGTIAAGNDVRFHGQNTDTGTSAQSFQLNNGTATSVRIKDNAGTLEVRNGADTAFADLTVQNLNVRGTQTIIDSNQVNIGDAVITLNADYTGSTPTENGGIEIERGTLTNAFIGWTEGNGFVCGLTGAELRLSRFVSRTFVAADLTAGSIAFTHNLGTQFICWQCYDNNANTVFPEVVATSSNIATFNFGNATITGTWRLVAVG